MYTADVARAKTLEITSKKEAQMVGLVEQAIDRSVNDGKFQCFFYQNLFPSVVKMLEDRGYQVSRKNELTIQISWSKK